jgi:adenylosuccinate lyase
VPWQVGGGAERKLAAALPSHGQHKAAAVTTVSAAARPRACDVDAVSETPRITVHDIVDVVVARGKEVGQVCPSDGLARDEIAGGGRGGRGGGEQEYDK